MRIGLLLAAGRSLRFGADDKLLAPLDGRPLVEHAAEALASVGLDRLVAVVSSDVVSGRLVPLGYDIVRNPEPEAGIGRSLAVGANVLTSLLRSSQGNSDMVVESGCVLVVLGDMPRVTPAHLTRLLDVPGQVVGSRVNTLLQPPARFDLGLLPALVTLEGDRGARDMLAGAIAIDVDPAELADVDTPDALSRLASPSA